MAAFVAASISCSPPQRRNAPADGAPGARSFHCGRLTVQPPLDPRQRGDDGGIELTARTGGDLPQRVLPAKRAAVRSVVRERVERVGDGEDPGAEGNRLGGQTVGIAAAVPVLVM